MITKANPQPYRACAHELLGAIRLPRELVMLFENGPRCDRSAGPIIDDGSGGIAMLPKMQAEILFLDPNDLNPTTAELVKLGFDVELLIDWIADDGPATWIYAWAISELDQSEFFDCVRGVVEPMGGDVVEAGHAWSSQGEPA